MKEVRLFTPGPTQVPSRVMEAFALPIIHHRSEEFREILLRVRDGMKRLAGTEGETVILTSSGTGAMEASVASFFRPGDEVLIVEGGKFGERWIKLAEKYQLKAEVMPVEWGKTVSPSELALRVNSSTKGVFLQACETSTGVFHPVPVIGQAFSSYPDLLFVVDGITALGIHDLNMERDRIDVLLAGSQKALMCPPGLATVSMSARAMGKLHDEASTFYLSLPRELKTQKKGATAFTPSVSLVRALDEALKMMEEEGFEEICERHQKLKEMTRAAFQALDFQLFNEEKDAANGLTVVCAPLGLEVKPWLKTLRKEEGLWLAGGQGKLEGKIFRIAHMGWCQSQDMVWALEVIEKSLAEKYPLAREKRASKTAKEFLKKDRP